MIPIRRSNTSQIWKYSQKSDIVCQSFEIFFSSITCKSSFQLKSLFQERLKWRSLVIAQYGFLLYRSKETPRQVFQVDIYDLE